ncbi:MAG TPA: hypothetical protein VK013_12200 [Myxococcaceae bacterium]|nr:hypothetical protein [Myxococcaceae bacterium]
MRPWILSLSTEARAVAVCGLSLLLLLPSPAFAATAEDRRAARAHFKEAEKAYAAGAYTEALTSYEQAYARFEAPAFLFNMAQCHRHLERPREALALYQRFLDASPDATNRTVVEGLVEEMKVAIAALPPPDFILLPSRTHFESVAQAPVAVAPVEPKRVHEQWWFWTAAAVVVGGVATGVALAAQPGGELPPASLGDINLR